MEEPRLLMLRAFEEIRVRNLEFQVIYIANQTFSVNKMLSISYMQLYCPGVGVTRSDLLKAPSPHLAAPWVTSTLPLHRRKACLSTTLATSRDSLNFGYMSYACITTSPFQNLKLRAAAIVHMEGTSGPSFREIITARPPLAVPFFVHNGSGRHEPQRFARRH